MYKHDKKPKVADEEVVVDGETESPAVAVSKKATSEEAHDTIQELLEKNLKWSQIIYEQNRKISHTLVWSAVASWLRFLIIAVPFALAIIYLPSFLRTFEQKYGAWLKVFQSPATAVVSPPAIQDLVNLLPLTDSQREQVKAMMK
jgi:hypothetical protein